MDTDLEIKVAREELARRKRILEDDLAIIEGFEYQLSEKHWELEKVQDEIASLERELTDARRDADLTKTMVEEAEHDLERLLLTDEDIEAERQYERQRAILETRYGAAFPVSIADFWSYGNA